MATFKAVLQTWKGERNDKRLILLRIQHDGRRKYLSLKEWARPSEWKQKDGKTNSRHRNQDSINVTIDAVLAKAGDFKARMQVLGQSVTADTLKAALSTDERKEDFWNYADSWLERIRKNQQVYYHRKCRSTTRKFEEYAGRPMLWAALTVDCLRGFDHFMLTVKENSQNTRRRSLKILRSIVSSAIMDGIIEIQDDPFHRFKPPKAVPTKKEILTLEEIRRLEELELKEGSWLCVSRDVFLFTFLLHGMRYGDAARMKWDSIGAERISYRMRKNNQLVSVKRTDRIDTVLNRYGSSQAGNYIFPILRGKRVRSAEKEVQIVSSGNALINKNLKSVAKLAGIEKSVSLHLSRHSFAHAAKTHGVDHAVIQTALRHSKSATTDKYLRELDDACLDDPLSVVTNILPTENQDTLTR